MNLEEVGGARPYTCGIPRYSPWVVSHGLTRSRVNTSDNSVPQHVTTLQPNPFRVSTLRQSSQSPPHHCQSLPQRLGQKERSGTRAGTLTSQGPSVTMRSDEDSTLSFPPGVGFPYHALARRGFHCPSRHSRFNPGLAVQRVHTAA